MLEIILKKDIFKLGERGDVVRVANGYARNYLYPQGLAIPADKGSLKQLESMRAAAAREAVKIRGDAEKQLEALEGITVRVVARASLNNQLYGSVTTRDIAAKLAELGIVVERQRIQLKSPIRILGDYEVPIHIYKDLTSTVQLEVRAEGREDEPLTRSLGNLAEFEFAPAPPPEEEEGEEGEELLEAEGDEAAEAGAESEPGESEEGIDAAEGVAVAEGSELEQAAAAAAPEETAAAAAPEETATADAPEEADATGEVAETSAEEVPVAG